MSYCSLVVSSWFPVSSMLTKIIWVLWKLHCPGILFKSSSRISFAGWMTVKWLTIILLRLRNYCSEAWYFLLTLPFSHGLNFTFHCTSFIPSDRSALYSYVLSITTSTIWKSQEIKLTVTLLHSLASFLPSMVSLLHRCFGKWNFIHNLPITEQLIS